MLARTKGSTNKKTDITKNTEDTKNTANVDNTTTETKRRGRQKGQKLEQNYVLIPLDNNYRVKWDSNNKALQIKLNKQELNKEDKEEIEIEEDGWKSFLYPSTWEDVGKCYLEELTRKKAIKQSKDNIIEINELINTFNIIEKKVCKLFKQLDVDKDKIKVGGK